MNEKILKALMQLFAIVVQGESVSTDGRKVVEVFLKQQLNQDLVNKYLKQFDSFLEEQVQATKKKLESGRKRTSVKDSVKVLLICTQINSELTQKQKIVVLIRLLEYIMADNQPSPDEIEFVSTVASTFNIDDDEIKLIKNFVFDKEELLQSPEILLIDNLKEHIDGGVKHIYSENLQGQIKILKLNSVNMYVARYSAQGELYLNGQIIRRNQVYFLTNGSSIRSSKINPIYYSDIVSYYLSDTSKSKIFFTVNDVEYKFKNGKYGLHSLNISEEGGKLIGIMGASGAGKSTLLNILNGLEKPTRGEVLINGINIHTEKERIEGVIGYVSQDDLLIEELTVFENLFFNAKLCFGSYNDAQIAKPVIQVLEDLGLYEIKDLKVGSPLNKKISGGQRKRLNIALELIREPSVLFVDEPTSGLSSRDSENIMDLLKELSLKGKQVYVVIHQPSSDIYKMFDKLLIIDVGGYPVYFGNPVDAIIYFKKIISHVNSDESECIQCGNVNPEQIFNILEAKVLDEYGNLTRERKIFPRQWNEYYLKQMGHTEPIDYSQQQTLPESSFNIPSKFKQFKVFITRDFLSKISNRQYVLINILEAPFLAFLLAFLVKFYSDKTGGLEYIFRDNENLPAYLFMNVVVALFMGLTVSAEEIIRDRKILKREEFLNLSRSSYLYSKVAILFFISAIQTLSFVLLGNWILEINGMTLAFWFALFTTSCFANLLGLNISASFNSAVTIYILIPILLIPQLLLSGVIVKFDKLHPAISSPTHVPLTGDLMTSRWTYEAMAVYQFKNNAYEKDFYMYDKIMSKADFKKNYWIPELRARLDYCIDNMNNPEDSLEYANKLSLIQNELDKESKIISSIKINYKDSITPAYFNASVGSKAKDYLNRLSKYYLRLYNKYNEKKDRIITSYEKTPELKKSFLKKRNEFENENLSDLLKNSKEMERIIEKKGELIQKIDPIFMDPSYKNPFDVRAHFFAPRKQFMGLYYDTYIINMIVIWIMGIILYITLYFESLKKLLDYLERVSGKFSKK